MKIVQWKVTLVTDRNLNDDDFNKINEALDDLDLEDKIKAIVKHNIETREALANLFVEVKEY